MMSNKWKLVSYDTSEERFYYIGREYPDKKTAQNAARIFLNILEDWQPSALSGGQGEFGTQDRVFVVKPDGEIYRILPISFPPTIRLY